MYMFRHPPPRVTRLSPSPASPRTQTFWRPRQNSPCSGTRISHPEARSKPVPELASILVLNQQLRHHSLSRGPRRPAAPRIACSRRASPLSSSYPFLSRLALVSSAICLCGSWASVITSPNRHYGMSAKSFGWKV